MQALSVFFDGMVKAIFFDIDGTLVSFTTHRIPPKVLWALQTLRRKGCLLFISSGRQRVSMDNLSGFEFDGYVSVNGAVCLVGKEHSCSHALTVSVAGHDYGAIHLAPMSRSDVMAHVSYCSGHALSCAAIAFDTWRMNARTAVSDEIFSLIRLQSPPEVDLERFVMDNDIYQLISFITASCEGEVLSQMPSSHLERWHPAFADIIRKGISKKVGIERMLEHFGIAPDECMAFGDGGNDIEMLRYIPQSVAMGNASQQVKDCASYVTGHVDDDGVFNALNHFGLV